jgi:hypothetical protein
MAIALLCLPVMAVAPPPAAAAEVPCPAEYRLAVDLNGDTFEDAVVGNPYATVNGRAEAGSVTVLFGDADGRIGEGARRVLTQADGGSRPEAGDHFGWSLSINEITSNRRPGLLIGSPHEDAPGAVDAGIAQVIQFVPPGQPHAGQAVGVTLTQADGGGQVEAGDEYGYSVVLGDARGRDNSFSFVGAPGEDVDGVADAGVINGLLGSDGGGAPLPELSGGNELGQGTAHLPGVPQAGDRFGATLAIADLAVNPFRHYLFTGAPGDEVDGQDGAGSVTVASLEDAFYAGPSGTPEAPIQLLTQNSLDVPGSAETGDGFGTSIAAGNQWPASLACGPWEYAIGVPGEDVGRARDAGGVNLFDSVSSSLRPAGWLDQNAPGLGGADTGDRFGATVAIRPTNDGLAVGAPGEDVGTALNAGAVVLADGSLTAPTNLRTITLDSPGVPGSARYGDRLGSSMGAQSGRQENVIAVGAPRLTGGLVLVLPQANGPVRAWTSGQGGVPGTARFGSALSGLNVH